MTVLQLYHKVSMEKHSPTSSFSIHLFDLPSLTCNALLQNNARSNLSYLLPRTLTLVYNLFWSIGTGRPAKKITHTPPFRLVVDLDLDTRWTRLGQGNNIAYYMTSSVSRQDKPNLALWLATRADKMQLSCLLGHRLCPRRKIYHVWCFIPYKKSFIDQGCLVKTAGYWPCCFFLRVYGPSPHLGP